MAPTPHIGDLRERVRLDHLVSTADGHGGWVSTYTDTELDTVWAAVWPISGREAVLAAQTTSVLSTVVWMWYRTDLSAKDRIVFGSRTLQIEDVSDPDGRRTWLKAICSEVQA